MFQADRGDLSGVGGLKGPLLTRRLTFRPRGGNWLQIIYSSVVFLVVHFEKASRHLISCKTEY